MTYMLQKVAYVAVLFAQCLVTLAIHIDKLERGSYRQRMENSEDMQYYADLEVGGQTIRGIFDTGSFELLVFGADCKSCGSAKAYKPHYSDSYNKGKRVRVQSYGSGSCTAVDARDNIGVGQSKLMARSQAFWQAVDCEMPLLNQAEFNAVVGIGPPGQATAVAMDELEQVKKIQGQTKKLGLPIPKSIQRIKREAEEDLEDAPNKPSMLESFDIETFSVCLERTPGAPGWITWNDQNPREQSFFLQIPVVGKITWGVQLKTVSLDGGDSDIQADLGCEEGCAAIVDTGTSLISVPNSVYQAAFKTIQGLDIDCSDISKFPDLIMRVGGYDLRFPPESYIGELVGEPSSEVKKYLHMSSLRKMHTELHKCEFLLMDMGNQKTQFGPMAILGMPFFREYYTSFDIGNGPGSRSIFIAKSDGDCHPASMSGESFGAKNQHYSMRKDRKPRQLRKVDSSKLRVPHWAHHGLPKVDDDSGHSQF